MLNLLFTLFIVMFTVTYTACTQQDKYIETIGEAIELYRSGEYQKSGEKFEEAFKIGEPNKSDFYNASCAWALAGNKDKAFANLHNSIDAGWLQIDHLTEDPDLSILRQDKRWDEAITKVSKNLSDIADNFPDKHDFIKTIELPEPIFESNYSVEEAIKNRRSVRSYKELPLSLQDVSQILWAAYGINKKIPGGPAFLRGGLRTAPSAGALYPLDIYVVVGEVTDLEAGIYYYDSEYHELKLTKKGDFREELSNAALSQMMLAKAPISLVYSAIFERTTKKYGQRGRDRYVMMDLGHSAENVYLQSGALGLGTCAIGAFSDISVKILINMTKEEEPLYLMPVGKLK